MTVSATDVVTNYPEYHAAIWVWKICPPVLIVLGTVGNTLSIIVLAQKRMRDSTVALYLSALAVVDSLVLYTGLLRQWIRYIAEIDIRTLSVASCKVHTWMVYFTLDLSVWILVAVTVERIISVWFPHKVKNYCTRMTALVAILVVAAALLALNSHFLYGLGDVVVMTDGVESIDRCTAMWVEYSHFQKRIWPWIDLCVFSLIPLVILIVGNISIVYKVISSRKKSRRIQPVTTDASQRITVRSRNTSSMTVMLLVLNIVFCVSTVPISVFLIGEPYWLDSITPQLDARLNLAWAVVNVLMYTNNSINFLMYSISGSRFRETFKDLFVRNSRIRSNNSMTMVRTQVSEATGSAIQPYTISTGSGGMLLKPPKQVARGRSVCRTF